MHQIVYISSTRRQVPVDPATILSVSRRNNARAGVTGLLFFDGRRFLQALEGEAAAVAATFARIQRDARHHALVVLSDRTVAAREFGDWAMADGAPGAEQAAALAQVTRLVAGAEPMVRATFEEFAKVRRAA